MYKHLKIFDVEGNNEVHASHPFDDRTLCGMALEGSGSSRPYNDGIAEFDKAEESEEKINCSSCIGFIEFCKKINKKEY